MTLLEMTFETLKNNSKQKFTARKLATHIIETFPIEFEKKRKNPRFTDKEKFISQVAAEIGRVKPILLQREGIVIDKQNRPQLYFYDNSYEEELEKENLLEETASFSENDLYSILGSYLKSELNIYSRRINEKTSKNNKGQNGNIWLHPDVVGIEPLDKHWNDKVKDCFKGAGGNRIKVYSFEVKRKIIQSKLREYFFQAVSNSMWANQGYLVAEELQASDSLFAELKMLSMLHGIGFILLNKENPSESRILLTARERIEPDWASVNRLVNENKDFKDFINWIKIYYESGEIHEEAWYK